MRDFVMSRKGRLLAAGCAAVLAFGTAACGGDSGGASGGGGAAEAGQGRAACRPLLARPASGALSPAFLSGEPAVKVVWRAPP